MTGPTPPAARASLPRRRVLAIVALVVVPVMLAALAGEIALLFRERRVMRPMGGAPFTVFRPDNRLTVLRLRKAGTPFYPFVGPYQFGFRTHPAADPHSMLFPLSGISTTPTQLCAADGQEVRYVSDEHGFANPPGAWNGPLELALIGDSFVQGFCVYTENQIGTGIRRAIPRTLNLGVVGAGPLIELAILREYAAPLRPGRVLWFFYEGNDVEDLTIETNSPLAAYFDRNFSQRLLARQDSIDLVLRRFADSTLAAEVRLNPLLSELAGVFVLRRVRAAMGFVAANAPGMSSRREYPALERVLLMAKREVADWGGEIIFVYLPDYHRFDSRVMSFAGWVHNNNEVHRRAVGAARAAGMPVIDVSAAFTADPNPRRFWTSPTSHYGPEGYEMVVRTVLQALDSASRPHPQ